MNQEGVMTMATVLKLGRADHGRPMTVDEFIAADCEEGYRYELIDGRLYVSPMPDPPQAIWDGWLTYKLHLYAQENPEVVNFVVNKARIFVPGRRRATIPEPDLAAYHDFPLHLPVREIRWQNVSPLLVGEVLSEDDPDKDLVRNVELYLQVPSIREYWVIDTLEDADNPHMLVYRRRGQRWQRVITVPSGGRYTTRLLPGFELVLDRHS
jgi:Uma2 family endonuclease